MTNRFEYAIVTTNNGETRLVKSYEGFTEQTRMLFNWLIVQGIVENVDIIRSEFVLNIDI